MRRILSLPAALALFVFTVHPEGATKRSSSDQSDTTKSRQTELSQQQKNQQSTFDPQRVSDSDLKKSVGDVNKASTFMGMTIQNLQNEKVGTVKDLVFDPESGKISYAVLSVGGFLGVGDKLIAVPLKSLRPQPGEKYLVLNMTKDEATRAPGLARNNWPRLDDPALGSPASSERSTSSSNSSNSQDTSSEKAKSPNSGSSPASDSGKSSDQPRESSDQPRESSDQPRESSDQPRESSDQPRESSDQLSAPQNSPTSSTTKDAQGSSPSSEKATTSNSGKDSGASPSTIGDSSDSDKSKNIDSKKS